MKKLLALTLVALSLILVNCKDKTDDPEAEKTLNKSLITNKYWKNPDGQFTNYFRSDGKYCSPNGTTELGTWQWLNNSDSLEIDYDALPDRIWYVKYCTDTEMSAKLGKNSSHTIFTKQ